MNVATVELQHDKNHNMTRALINHANPNQRGMNNDNPHRNHDPMKLRSLIESKLEPSIPAYASPLYHFIEESGVSSEGISICMPQLNLMEFSNEISGLLTPKQGCPAASIRAAHLAAKYSDEVEALFRRLTIPKEGGWDKFAFFDPLTPYTRNLIATDHETFTLLLLCWSPNKESPIHDHPCDGCWLQVLEGSVVESRYVHNAAGDKLTCTKEEEFHEGDFGYINDFIGYHKMGNASKTKPSVTLHLYCPPFQSCNIWLEPSEASQSSQCGVCMYSEYGHRIAR